MTAVDAVLFDVDDTLCEYRRGADELLAAAFDEVGVEPYFDVAEYYAAYERYVDDSTDMVDLRERCFAALSRERGREPEVGVAVAEAYAGERDHGNVRPLPGAVEAVRGVAADHRVGVVTNGAPGMQRRKLSAIGLDGAFETAVFAGYDVPAKPDPEPFERALSDLGVAPDRTVHVGNSLSSDVPGARAAGVRAAWLARDGVDADPEPAPDYRLDSMRELTKPPWLG